MHRNMEEQNGTRGVGHDWRYLIPMRYIHWTCHLRGMGQNLTLSACPPIGQTAEPQETNELLIRPFVFCGAETF